MRPAAAVSGFAAWYLANVLTGQLAQALERHTGQIDPGRLAEVRETWALIKRMGDDYAAEQQRITADGSAAMRSVEAAPRSAHEITTDQAAGMLGLTPRRVRQLLAAGLLDGRLAGRTWLVRRQSVLLYRDLRSAA